jgi:hypothetical protein
MSLASTKIVQDLLKEKSQKGVDMWVGVDVYKKNLIP